MRPRTLDEFAGQKQLVGPDAPLRAMLDVDRLPSSIFFGPPGSGKTTLAKLCASLCAAEFEDFSAVTGGVAQVREIIARAKKRQQINKRTLLFVDEIHRFNKGQQDALLGAVEKGIITLIGATTENPSFEVNSALLSRCQVYILKPLEKSALISLMNYAVKEDEILSKLNIEIKETEALINLSGGDARRLLNLLELTVDQLSLKNDSKEKIVITDDAVINAAQQKVALYDKKGEQHYDIISAFIKSIRGSDPNAAVYWMARMIEGGEDVKFIARRMVILASEDIGNANPTALVLATNTFQAVNLIGYPEANIILSQCATYLASSPKSNAAVVAIGKAQSLVKQHGDLPVPLAIRNAPTKLMKNLDYGKNYQYAHNFENNFVNMEFLPEEIKNALLYNPGKNAREEELRKFLKMRWKEKYGY